jgi:hypothetical protein
MENLETPVMKCDESKKKADLNQEIMNLHDGIRTNIF